MTKTPSPLASSSPPNVSVVMTTYNRAHLLPHAIRNIIAQTFTDWELIIVDDASTDTTKEVVHDFIKQDPRIRYHRHQHNSGLAVARNTSFQLARGRYIAFQDDDDFSHIRRLEVQSQYLDAHPDVDMVTSWLHVFQNNRLCFIKKNTFHYQKDKPQSLKTLTELPTTLSCFMARRCVFHTVPMRPFFRAAEDYDAFLRCSERYTLTALPAVLYHYRLGDSTHASMSNSDADKLSRCWQYHCLAWGSAFHRRMGWTDPIDKAETITDALNHLHPQFHTKAQDSVERLRLEFAHISRRIHDTGKNDIFSFYRRFAGEKERKRLVTLSSSPRELAKKTRALPKPNSSIPSKHRHGKSRSPLLPTVSVVIATYNRAHLLPDAIRSIINQTYKDWELIIIDDASTDMTEVVVRAFMQQDPRIRYYRHQTNSGLAVARNTSTQLALGSYIALQDDDDICLPHRLKTQVDFLNGSDDIDLVGSWVQCFNKEGPTEKIIKTEWQSRADTPPTLAERVLHPMPSSSIMARRHVFIETPMRPFFSVAEDYDFLLRCTERYNLSHIPKTLYHYRMADGEHATLSTSHNRSLNVLKYHLAAWASACYRHSNKKDPVETETNVDDLLHKARPLFHSASKQAKKHLLAKYAFDHFDLTWQTHDPKSIKEILVFLKNLFSRSDYIFVLSYYVKQNHLAIEQLYTRYYPPVTPSVFRLCCYKGIRDALQNNDEDLFQWWLDTIKLYSPYRHRWLIAPRIIWTCWTKRDYHKIMLYLATLLMPKRIVTETPATPPSIRTHGKAPPAHVPQVSVILPTHNRSSLLQQAIDSIRQQTFTDWELIIIDDGSSDDTEGVVRSATADSRIRYQRHSTPKGAGIARNTGAQLARGTYIALQDDDDRSLPHRLQMQVDFLNGAGDVDLVSSWVQCFNKEGPIEKIIKTEWKSRADTPPTLAERTLHPMPFACIMARRHVFTETPMRAFFPVAEDYDFLLRCTERYTLSHIPKTLYHYRLADDEHRTLSTSASQSLSILKYHFAAWASACYRHSNKKDPVETETNVDDLLHKARPLFHSASKQAKKHLLAKYAFDHFDLTWQTQDPQNIKEMLNLLKNMLTKADYTNLLDSHSQTIPEHLVPLYVTYRHDTDPISLIQHFETNIRKAILDNDENLCRQWLNIARRYNRATIINS